MIRLRNVKKSYGRNGAVLACDVAALDVADGEQVALVGRSGSGKTTLLHVIAGILRPDAGEVVVLDQDLADLGEGARDRFRGRHIGMVYQTFNLLQPFDALENVLLGALFGRGAGHAARDRAEHLLERVGLAERRHHRPGQLSVGQVQRVAICRALINDPELILMDEPLGNQDRETGGKVLELLLELAREGRKTVVMVTHDPDSAARMQRTVDLHQLRSGT
jgi:ABC-type lipoprotein export system ATPase subunit